MGHSLNIYRIPMNWSKTIKYPIKNCKKEVKHVIFFKSISKCSKRVRQCWTSLVVIVKKIQLKLWWCNYSPTGMVKQEFERLRKNSETTETLSPANENVKETLEIFLTIPSKVQDKIDRQIGRQAGRQVGR